MALEIEFKFAVADDRAFDALIRYLDLPAREFHPSLHQVNHFFDTSAFALRGQDLMLRLREESGRYLLALKGRDRNVSPDGVLTERLEEEVRLPPGIALEILQGSLSPRVALAERIGERGSAALVALDQALGPAELHYVGKFENRRTRLPAICVPVGEQEVPVIFELDRTTFPGPRIEFEIEVEVRGGAEPERLHAGLVALLARAGVPWQRVESKARRFFATLKGR